MNLQTGPETGAPPAARMRPHLRMERLQLCDLAGLEDAWSDVAAAAAEPNPFFSPYLLSPAAPLMERDAFVACAFDDAGALAGLIPLAPARDYARLPIPFLETFLHRHCFFGAPLVRFGAEEAFFEALYAFADRMPGSPSFIRLKMIAADGPLLAAAERAAAASGRSALRGNSFERAMLRSGVSSEAYLETAVRKKKRKEWGRLRNRLQERGAVVFAKLASASQLGPWSDAFLALEFAGWKGRAGTALAASDGEFFKEAVAGAFKAGALRFYRLDCDDRPIAMIVNFIERGEGYSFKIAHDETFARFSPGVHIEVDMLKALDREPDFSFFDSCARPDHPMIDNLWRERRKIASLNVSLGGLRGRALLKAGGAIEAAAARLRRKAEEGGHGDL